MGPKGLAWTAGSLLFLSALAHGEFVPGDIYVADFAEKACAGPYDQYPGDRIYRINPETAEVSLFAALDGPECGGVTGMVFTPDGTRLRVAQYFRNRILEFDSEGNYSVLYDSSNGIFAPLSANCITFDSEGNFFVSVFRRILKFAPGSTMPQIFAAFETNPFVTHSGPLAIDSLGFLNYVSSGGGGGQPGRLLKFSGPNSGSVTVTYEFQVPASLQSDSCGNLFVGRGGSQFAPGGPIESRIDRFANGDPATETLLIQSYELLGQHPILAMDPSESRLYVHVLRLSLFDLSIVSLTDNMVTPFVRLPSSGEQHAGISGIAVVPVSPTPYGLTPCPPPIPTVSSWGFAILILLFLIRAKVSLRTRKDVCS